MSQSQLMESASTTAIIREIDSKQVKIEYIDIMSRPDLCGKSKWMNITEGYKFELNDIVHVEFIPKMTRFGKVYSPTIEGLN